LWEDLELNKGDLVVHLDVSPISIFLLYIFFFFFFFFFFFASSFYFSFILYPLLVFFFCIAMGEGNLVYLGHESIMKTTCFGWKTTTYQG